MPDDTLSRPWKDRAWVFGSALVPAALAAGHLGSGPEAGEDVRVIRAVGLGYTGGFRELDAWLAAPFAALPLGTRTLRAELPGVLLVGLVGALVFLLVRRVVADVSERSGWGPVVAAVGSATVSLSYPFQHEATRVGSSLAGVALVLVTLLAALATDASWRSVAALAGWVGLSFSYEPSLGVLALAVAASCAIARPKSRAPSAALPSPVARVASLILAAACGMIPLLLALLRGRVTPLSTSARLLGTPLPAHAATLPAGPRHAVDLLDAELGTVLLVLAAIGIGWGLLHRRARPSTVPLAALTVVAYGVLTQEKGATADAWSAVGLVTIVGLVACASIAMHEAVLRVARARLPLASASAAMVVVLEAAFPAMLFDDGLTRAAARPTHAVSAWVDAAFAGLPSGALVLVSAPSLYARLLATEASGELPGDFEILPTFNTSNEAAASALAHDVRLVPLFRDMALLGTPEELSLSALATARPVALATDPRWDKNLTRHLLPAGLLAAFEPEPRGGADRKRALEQFAPARERLLAALGVPLEPALGSLTESILFDRAISAAKTGEQEVALRALDDAAAFAPGDARIVRLRQKELTAHGALDVHELVTEGLSGEGL